MPAHNRHIAFVTGGTGFVGSHLVEYLLGNSFQEVRCLVRTDPKYLTGLPITTVRGSMSDKAALAKGVEGADYVFHVAALTRAQTWHDFQEANIEGSGYLLETVRSVNPDLKKVVVTSSLATIGCSKVNVATETTPLQPISQYGRSKAMMEELVHSFTSDLPIVIVRPPAVYGPRESDLFTYFQSLSRGFCPIVGSGKKKALSLVHVSDLVRGMVQAGYSDNTNGETYFLGGASQYSWNEIRDASATALGRRVLTIPIPRFLVGTIGAVSELAGKLTGTYPPLNREKAAEIRYACLMCDHSKATADFDYAPDKDLWSGIDETIQWYRKESWL